MITARWATPASAVGLPVPGARGFQNDSQAPVQSTLPFASWSGVYSAIPLLSTRTSPKPSTCATDTVSELLAGADDDEFPLSSPLEPQAASARAPAMIAADADSRFMSCLLGLGASSGRPPGT